ncbi:hypothetical protein AAG570_005881 [Ranatra chinensis]|uniref:Uncharacterized protein n=1 Tax=Ranatra chinensis TaxID=642074 RepID=A0ABD0XWE4_9HEMI
MWKFASRNLRESLERSSRLGNDRDNTGVYGSRRVFHWWRRGPTPVTSSSRDTGGRRVCCWWRGGGPQVNAVSDVDNRTPEKAEVHRAVVDSKAQGGSDGSSGPKHQRKRWLPYSLCDTWLGAFGYSGALIVGWVFSQPSSECRWKKWYNSFRSAVGAPPNLHELNHCKDADATSRTYPCLLQLLARGAVSHLLIKKAGTTPGPMQLSYAGDDDQEAIEYGPITAEQAGEELRHVHDSIAGEIENREGVECMSRREHAKAVQLFRSAAVQRRYPAAAYNLAQCYELGLGTKQDFTQAAEWYRRGSELGHPTSKYNLGVFYAHGWGGLEANKVQAKRLIEEAARLGQPDALEALGVPHPPSDSSAGITPQPTGKNNFSSYQDDLPDYNEDDLNMSDRSTTSESSSSGEASQAQDSDPVQLFNLALSYENSIQNSCVDPYLILETYQLASDMGHLEAKSKLRVLKAFDAIGLLSDYLMGLIKPVSDVNEPTVSFMEPASSCVS